jgi:ech hydrogenase subunit C
MGNPKHANVLLVTGPPSYHNYRVLRNLYEQMSDHKGVIVGKSVAAPPGLKPSAMG